MRCESLSRLEKLETLYLEDNKFNKSIILCLSSLISLKNLSLYGNNLGDPFPARELTVLKNLETLDLSFNDLSSLTMQGLCKLKKLEALDISHNHFEGILPSCQSNLTSLKFFDISLNQFTGNISPSLFGSLNSLEYIGLSHNRFEGLFSFGSFANHSNLEVVELISDNDKFEVDTKLTDWIPLFQLKILVLSNYNLNKLSGDVPKFLLYQNKLMRSIIPSCSNRNLQYLEHMHLQGNKFTGDNIFFGSIPDSIRLLSNLRILLFRGNQLSGSIPIQLCQLHQINLMDLSNNYLNGSIPPRFSNITFGTIGASDRPTMQRYIYSFGYYATYQYKGIFETNYIPCSEVMYDEVDKIEFVTKSRSNSYKGNILNFMSGLDLSHNKLIGEIPFELGKLSSIRAPNLSHNLLTGPIPKTFSNLAQIESLKLSYNSLSGNISTKLINLNFLEVFTVAHNNLSGKILDRNAQFKTFEASSYEGNPFLCGSPLEKNCTAIVDSPHLPQ
ncbi:unnamed protein product [Camellia sinensis]